MNAPPPAGAGTRPARAEAVPAAHAVDGRRARRDRNRDKVVDALLDLYREGQLAPSISRVAERSGVSHRSVFRYFEDLDQLCRAAIERHSASVADLLEIDDLGVGSLSERIEMLVTRRVDLYAVVAPVARVTRMRAPLQPLLEERIAADRRRLDRQVAQHFEVELTAMEERDRLAAACAVNVLCSLDSLELMRHSMRLSRSETIDTLSAALARILDPSGSPA